MAYTLRFRHDGNTLDGLGIYHQPSRSDAQGPRLRQNVFVVTEPEDVNPTPPAPVVATPSFKMMLGAGSTAAVSVAASGVTTVGQNLNVMTVWSPGSPGPTPPPAQSSYLCVASQMSTWVDWGAKPRPASGGFQLKNSVIGTGKIVARMRLTRSVGTRGVGLLWPNTAPWPDTGEFDFFECSAPGRDTYDVTNHWGPEVGGKHPTQRISNLGADWSAWHIFEVEKTATDLILRIDGQEHRPKGGKWTFIPSSAMWLGFQTALTADFNVKTWTPGYLHIDYIEVYDGVA